MAFTSMFLNRIVAIRFGGNEFGDCTVVVQRILNLKLAPSLEGSLEGAAATSIPSQVYNCLEEILSKQVSIYHEWIA